MDLLDMGTFHKVGQIPDLLDFLVVIPDDVSAQGDHFMSQR
jgi:hypothetical protein